jgi:hypothetical protein
MDSGVSWPIRTYKLVVRGSLPGRRASPVSRSESRICEEKEHARLLCPEAFTKQLGTRTNAMSKMVAPVVKISGSGH